MKYWNEMHVLIVASQILYECTNDEKWFKMKTHKSTQFGMVVNKTSSQLIQPFNCSLIHKENLICDLW